MEGDLLVTQTGRRALLQGRSGSRSRRLVATDLFSLVVRDVLVANAWPLLLKCWSLCLLRCDCHRSCLFHTSCLNLEGFVPEDMPDNRERDPGQEEPEPTNPKACNGSVWDLPGLEPGSDRAHSEQTREHERELEPP